MMQTELVNPPALLQSLVTAGVLGLDRNGQILVSGCLMHTADSELTDKFLSETAILNLYCRAGYKPAIKHISETACEQDEIVCGFKSAEHLRRILYGGFIKLLGEWCRTAIYSGWTAPYALICDLLDKALDSKSDDREPLLNVVGKRGKWIAQLNPRWRSLFKPDLLSEDLWENGEHEQRIYFLEKLRQTDPIRARELLIATWPTEPADKRARLLATLKINLSLDDQEFLEQILKEKLKTLRTASAELLAHMPESTYCVRMGERLGMLMKFSAPKKGILLSKKASFDITLPEPEDKTLINDGIQGKQMGKLGPKAVALMQMVGASPLGIWNAAAEDIITASLASEWRIPLLLGFATAITRQRNAGWAQAFVLEFELISKALEDGSEQVNAVKLMKLVPEADREKIAAKCLEHSKVWQSSAIITIIHACDHHWSRGFSFQILNSIQQHFRSHHDPYANAYLRRLILDEFALRLSPEIVDEVNKPWPGMSDKWSKSDIEMVTTLATVINFRREMLKELTHES